MSYCRFSSNDYQCDIYVYHDVGGGITVHVAGTRVMYQEPLPKPVPFSEDRIQEWLKRNQEVERMFEMSPHEDIVAEHAGESFYGLSEEGAVGLIRKLQGLGYRIPEGVVEALQEDLLESAQSEERRAS